MTELRTWPETLDYIAANGDFEDDEDAEMYREMARDWRALEAENARLHKELMTAYASERSQERARIRREQAEIVQDIRDAESNPGWPSVIVGRWADRLEEATRDA